MAKKLLDQLCEALRLKHYSYRTEEAYVDWVRRFVLFHNKRHPAEMSTPEIRAFLAHLAQDRNVSASEHLNKMIRFRQAASSAHADAEGAAYRAPSASWQQ